MQPTLETHDQSPSAPEHNLSPFQKNPERYAEEVASLGLSMDRLIAQNAAILAALSSHHRPLFKIVDTCHKDNGGLFKIPEVIVKKRSPSDPEIWGFIAFVPAAGAASRYSLPFQKLIEALETGHHRDLAKATQDLRDEGALDWPLHPLLEKTIRDCRPKMILSEPQRQELISIMTLPKALMPCVAEGDSFLDLKLAEHQALAAIDGQVYIVPSGMEEVFSKSIETSPFAPSKKDHRIHLIPQGPRLSTLRFHPDGTPVRDQHGRLSSVPAGHGALIEVIPEVKQKFPDAHSLLIRNVDNIAGNSPSVIQATEEFMAFHQLLLGCIRGVRLAFEEDDTHKAANFVETLWDILNCALPYAEQDHWRFLDRIKNKSERILWDLQFRLFHTPRPPELTLEALKKAYARPVNTLGQVPNTGRDIGGTPCFIQHGDQSVKVCIEVPHVSPDDRRKFLENPAKSTHFNPVFVAAELFDDKVLSKLRDHDFWVLSEKQYRGQPVVYFETVLYEILGNSHLANCTFVEIPRLLFNPHKSVQDAAHRRRRDWLDP